MMESGAAEKLSVDIIVPLYNEAASLGVLHSKLSALLDRLSPRCRVSFLFVDDGSTDGTAELLSDYVLSGASWEIYRHPHNMGVGAAFRTGFERCSANVVCTIDADCTYEPESLSGMIEIVAAGIASIAVASPYHPEGRVEGVQPWRIGISKQCSQLYRWLMPVKLYTYTSIFRAYSGDAARQIRFSNDGFVSAVEILLNASRLGYSIAEVPLTLRRRTAGMSKMRVARTIRAHVRLMLRYRFRAHGPSEPSYTGSAEPAPDCGPSYAASTECPPLSGRSGI